MRGAPSCRGGARPLELNCTLELGIRSAYPPLPSESVRFLHRIFLTSRPVCPTPPPDPRPPCHSRVPFPLSHGFPTTRQSCSLPGGPVTGWRRDGYCNTDQYDQGSHCVCCELTIDFLEYTKSKGNDLSTPRGGFPGLKPGDRWWASQTTRAMGDVSVHGSRPDGTSIERLHELIVSIPGFRESLGQTGPELSAIKRFPLPLPRPTLSLPFDQNCNLSCDWSGSGSSQHSTLPMTSSYPAPW